MVLCHALLMFLRVLRHHVISAPTVQHLPTVNWIHLIIWRDICIVTMTIDRLLLRMIVRQCKKSAVLVQEQTFTNRKGLTPDEVQETHLIEFLHTTHTPLFSEIPVAQQYDHSVSRLNHFLVLVIFGCFLRLVEMDFTDERDL
jgi:hypothetical protein